MSNTHRWTKEEDARLLEAFLPGVRCQNWAMVAYKFTNGRSAAACRQRYLKLRHTAIMPNRMRLWTEEEDEIIRRHIGEFGRNWSLYKPLLPKRHVCAIRYHVTKFYSKDLDAKLGDARAGGIGAKVGQLDGRSACGWRRECDDRNAVCNRRAVPDE